MKKRNVAHTSIHINGAQVPVCSPRRMSGGETDYVLESVLFREWCQNQRSALTIEEVTIQAVCYRNNTPSVENVSFVVLLVNYFGKPHDFVLMLTSSAVCILPVIHCEDELYTVVVEEFRAPFGTSLVGLPAGKTDGGNARAKALQELEEETGIRPNSLVQLAQGVCLTPGYSNETMDFFCTDLTMTRKQLDSFNGRRTGVAAEGEQLVTKIVPFDDLRTIGQYDIKTLLIYLLFQEKFPRRKA